MWLSCRHACTPLLERDKQLLIESGQHGCLHAYDCGAVLLHAVSRCLFSHYSIIRVHLPTQHCLSRREVVDNDAHRCTKSAIQDAWKSWW
jgi:hypothetical protein